MPVLSIDIEAKFAKFQDSLDLMERSTKRAADSMSSAFAGVRSALAAIGVTVGAGAFVAMIKGTIDAAAHLEELSKSTGITVETLGGLGFAAVQVGSSLDAVGKAVGKLDLAIAKAKSGTPEFVQIFKNLGISIADLNNDKPDEIFAKIADRFAGTADGANKAAYGAKLFGKAYQDTIPLLDAGGDKLRENVEYFQKFSGVSEETAHQSAEFNKEMAKLHLLSGAFASTLASALLPAMQDLVKEIVKFKEESSGTSTVVEGIIEVMKVLAVVGVNTSFTFSTIGKELARFAENVKLIATGDFEGSKNLGKVFAEDAAKARAEVDALTARILAFNTVKAKSGVWGGDPWGAMGPKDKPKPDLPNLPVTGAAETEVKRFISALQTLEKEYFNLTNEGKRAAIMWEEEHGSLQKLTPEHKAALLVMADRIDAYRRLVIIQTQSGELIKSEVLMAEKGRDAKLDQAAALRQEIDDMQFQNTLFGKTANEVEVLTAKRKIDLEVRQRILAMGPDEDGQMRATQEQMRAAADKQKTIFGGMIADRQKLDREWSTGANAAFTEYIDHATNAAEQARSAFTTVFKGMEDALVDFVMTGGKNFKSLANSIIADLVRIQIRASITGPIAAAMKGSGGLLGLLGMGGSAPSAAAGAGDYGGSVWNFPTYATGTDYVQSTGLAMVHQGEKIIPAGGGGGTYYIDARSADSAGLARLENTIRDLNGSIEHRALGAVRQAYNARGRTSPLG